MDKSIIIILDDIQKKLDKSSISYNRKEKICSEIKYLKEQYGYIESFNNHKEVYDSLVKRGRELNKETNLKDVKKVDYYLNYCHAALYDFMDNLKPLNWLIRGYLASCILFLALTPQYLGAMVPLLLLIPIYLGLKGMKKRSKTGFMYGISVMPMSILTSVMVIKFEFLNYFNNFAAHVAERAHEINRSVEFTQTLMIVVIALSIVMLITSIYTIIIGMKHRKMFI